MGEWPRQVYASLGKSAATGNPGIKSTSALVNRCDDDDNDDANDKDNDNDYVCVCVVLRKIVVFVLVVLVLAVVSAIINNMKRSDAIS